MSRILLPLLLLVACGGASSGGPSNSGDHSDTQADRRVLVEVEPAQLGTVADYLATTGVLESEAQADIVPEVGGVVTAIRAEEGDAVHRGQLLATLASPSLDANASRAGVELDRARRAAQEAENLHGSGVISDQALRDAQASLRVAEATFDEAARSHGFTRITSPIDGTVAVREVRVGEMAGGKRAFQIVDLDHLRVVVNLPEKDLRRMHIGQTALLIGAYDADARSTGHVQRISPVVDPQTGTVRVTIAVDPAAEGAPAIRPGQFVKVRVEVDRHQDVLTIPLRGLVWIDGEPIAWVVVDAPPEEDEQGDTGQVTEEPGFFARLFDQAKDDAEPDEDLWAGVPRRKVDRHRLTIGFSDPDRVEVLDGLVLDESVVVVGNATLREDSEVRLPGDPAPKKPEEDDE